MRNNLIVISILLISVFTIGCNRSESSFNQADIKFANFPEVDTISFKKLFEYEEGVAGLMVYSDSNLVIANYLSGRDYNLNNYSLKDKVLSEGYIGAGKGFAESIIAIPIGVVNNHIWLGSVTSHKLLLVDKASAFKDRFVISHSSVKEFKLKHSCYWVAFKDSTTYYSVDPYNESQFRVREVDAKSGNIINEFGKYNSFPNNISTLSYKKAYKHLLYAGPKGDKVVLPYLYTDRIEIINTESGKSTIVFGPDCFEPTYKPTRKGIETTEKTRYSFIACAVTEKYIYISYSGKSEIDDEEYCSYGHSIFIYDWSGNPIKRLEFDNIIDGIAVSDDNETLYAFDSISGNIVESKINL